MKWEQWFDSDWVVLSFRNSTLWYKDEMFTEFHSCSAIYKVFFFYFLEIIYIEKGLPSLDTIIIAAVRMKYKVQGNAITYIW